MPSLPHMKIYNQDKNLLSLKEEIWNLKMSKSHGKNIKWKLMSGFSLFLILNIWILYKRVAFYMEHSFDILNPDINYLIERY